ncbi:MAG TPA: hypothetical protein VFM55_17690 [Micromonosporaceae bacterium]|nr:hypothetical protein [Micromonosporaceae bacterium]
MGVVPSGGELSRAITVALLSRVLGADPDLHGRVAGGEFTELVWDTERTRTQWFVHPGEEGISSLMVSIWDSFPLRPAAAYRAAVTPIVEALQELAQASGGRFIVEEGDVTGAPLGEVLDMIAPEEASPLPPGVVLSVSQESDQDFLRRYLAAGDDRLAWLRTRAGRSGGPSRLDLSRESLAPLWDWAISQIQLRDANAPTEKVMLETGGTFTRPVGAVLPMWYGRHPFLAPSHWSDESLAVIDAVAFYAAQAVRDAVPGLTWQVGEPEFRGKAQGGQPVLAGRGEPLQPVRELLGLATKVYHLRRPDPDNPCVPPIGDDLLTWFDAEVADRRHDARC